MEIKLWRAVVKYFAPIFPADERRKRRGELWEEERAADEGEREEGQGENGGKKAQAAITKRQETIIIAP